jgi:hypothetical protein
MRSGRSVLALWVAPLLAVAACSDKTVALDVQLPPASLASQFNTSCVKAVQVYVNGESYDDDGSYSGDCVELDAPAATFADLRSALRGTIDVDLPPTGLSGVEMFGFAGACDAARIEDYDLIFYAEGPYIGGDSIPIPMVPNLDCDPLDVVIKPIDLLKLVKSGCAMATWTEGKIGLTTLSPLPFYNDVTDWWGGTSAALVTSGLVSVRGNVDVAPRSCLAAGLYTSDWVGVTCMPPAAQRVCATGAQYEAPMMNLGVWAGSQDSALVTEWGGLIIGAVYGMAPIANATVTLDEDSKDNGVVVYFDMPAGVENGTGALTKRPGTTTGPSGLFGVYTAGLVNITVTANGQTVKRFIGGHVEEMSAVVVKM